MAKKDYGTTNGCLLSKTGNKKLKVILLLRKVTMTIPMPRIKYLIEALYTELKNK